MCLCLGYQHPDRKRRPFRIGGSRDFQDLEIFVTASYISPQFTPLYILSGMLHNCFHHYEITLHFCLYKQNPNLRQGQNVSRHKVSVICVGSKAGQGRESLVPCGLGPQWGRGNQAYGCHLWRKTSLALEIHYSYELRLIKIQLRHYLYRCLTLSYTEIVKALWQ